MVHLCKAARLSRSGYYKFLSQPSFHAEIDNIIVSEIQRIQEKTKYTYGYRRLKIALEQNLGFSINKKKIQRIQNEYQLHAKTRRRRLKYPQPVFQKEAPKENILKRDFTADAPNEKWVTDITYIKNGKNRLYMSALMDLHNREIISYRISDSLELPFVLETFEEAFHNYKPNNVIIHSDQGGHYTSPQFCRLLEKHHAIQSMSRRGNCWDNASMENFFGHFKSELIHRIKPMSAVALRQKIDMYIDFYNNTRIQTKFKMAPVEYRNHLVQTA